MKNEKQQAAAASQFAQRWAERGYEKGESQKFWLELLGDVFGVEHPTSVIEFEDQVMLDNTSFIDGYIPTTRVMIEQKSLGKDLRKPIRQSDGSMLTPFQQAKRYVAGLPLSRHPRWVVVCNFAEFLVYDMERPNREPEHIQLADLGKEWYRLRFLVDTRSEHLARELEVSMQAGEIIGEIYDALLGQYGDSDAETLRMLNILCVRLVFCLYAEDAGIFGHDQFHDYLVRHDADMMRTALLQLFEVLNTPTDKRSRYMREELQAFPYTNGGLFAEAIDIPQFTPELAQLLLQNASLDFDWSEISPTIFGAVFESTLNPVTRRSGGMHYTSIENIHKVIDPLFLDDLRAEFAAILDEKSVKSRHQKLLKFQDKLASLTFLDPACGSGNFLTETYLSLRRLENEVVRELTGGRAVIGFEDITPIKVSINQFHGIEINDFAVTVATTALWISEAQMLAETEHIIHRDIDFLPLKTYANIREGNALRMDWDIIDVPDDIITIHADKTYLTLEHSVDSMVGEPVLNYGKINLTTSEVLPGPQPAHAPVQVHYDYIIGNPPFVGARMMSKEQKADVISVFGHKWPSVGNLDYVCCWFKKAVDLMQHSSQTCAAFVSTNSICQGEHVANLWRYLFNQGIHINFAHRTFRWDSESSLKAHVHCVVVGFSFNTDKTNCIFDNEQKFIASNINAYLIDAPDVFVGSRITPLCDVPTIGIGNKPIDGGNYLFEKDEMEDFIRKEPQSAQYFHPWYGAQEFINQRPRYCLWLGDCTPSQLQAMPHCLQRVRAVQEFRKTSKSPGTVRLAERPTRFHVENMPKGNFIVIPQVSSQNRRYIPMGYMDARVLCSDKVRLMEGGSLYHFGILESNVHMAWMRVICARLKSDYSYTINNVYNNFPWPEVTEGQKAKIEQTAQAILDARALYPDSSLADLYDEVTMPPELRKAHQANDRAVMEAYGMPWRTMTESQCVAELFKRYQELTAGE